MALSMQKKVTSVGHFRFNSHISIGIPAFLQCQQSINPEFSCPLNCGNYENLSAKRNQINSLYHLKVCACMHGDI